jgi:hypothetical protein
VSQNLVGNAAVAVILCLCEAELISCVDVESLAPKPASNIAFANRLTPVRA